MERVRAVRKRRAAQAVEIVPFAPEHGAAFKALNLEWIKMHWEPEPADFKALDHPRKNILDPGGYIAIAVHGEDLARDPGVRGIEEPLDR